MTDSKVQTQDVATKKVATQDKPEIDKPKAKKSISKKAQKANKKSGKVSLRLEKLLKSVDTQKEKGKGKISLSIAQQNESSLIQSEQTSKRAKSKGMTIEKLEKNQLRKYKKGERAFIQVIALGVIAKRIDPSYIPLESIKTEFDKLGLDFVSNWACIRHNAYQTYCKSPDFTKGFQFCLNVETYLKQGKETCKPFTMNQGFLLVNPEMKKEFSDTMQIVKKDKSLVNASIKFYKTTSKVSYFN